MAGHDVVLNSQWPHSKSISRPAGHSPRCTRKEARITSHLLQTIANRNPRGSGDFALTGDLGGIGGGGPVGERRFRAPRPTPSSGFILLYKPNIRRGKVRLTYYRGSNP